MRLLVAAAFIAGSTSTTAFAADVVAEEPPAPVAVVPIFTWTGGYVSIQGGWSWADLNEIETLRTGGAVETLDEDYDADGFIGGVRGGYNWQVSQVVFGGEADIEFSTVEGAFRLPGNGNGTDFEQDWQTSIRARVGLVPIDRLLLYVTGGVAFSGMTFTQINAEPDKDSRTTESFDSTEAGWTFGAGAEYAFTHHLIAHLEYRHADFGIVSYESLVAFPDSKFDEEPQLHAFRVGFGYKF